MWTLKREQYPDDFESPIFEEVDGRVYKLGRTAEVRCQSIVISRNHCEIEFRNGAWFIRDLGSLNGTYVNGMQATRNEWIRIQHDDKIGLGSPDVVSEEDLQEEQEQYHFFIFRFINQPDPVAAVEEQNDVHEVEIINVPDSSDEEQVIPEPPKPAPTKIIAEFSPKPGPSSRPSNNKKILIQAPNEAKSTTTITSPIPSPQKIIPSKTPGVAAAPSIDSRAKISKPDPASSKKSCTISVPSPEKILKNLKAGPASWKKSQSEKNEPLKRASENRGRDIDESPSSKRSKLVVGHARPATRKLPSTSESDDADDVVHRSSKNVFKDKEETNQGGKANVVVKHRISQSSSSSSPSGIPSQKGRGAQKSTSSPPPILRWCSGEKMEQMIICIKRAIEVTHDGFKWDPLITKRISKETKGRLERQLRRNKDLEVPASKASRKNMIGQGPSTSSAPATRKSPRKTNDDDLEHGFEKDHTNELTSTAANGLAHRSSSIVQKPLLQGATTTATITTGYSPARGPINVQPSNNDLVDSESDSSIESVHFEDNLDAVLDDEPAEQMEWQEAEEDEEDYPLETAQHTSAGRQGPRKIQLLDHAPTPRQHRLKPSNQSGRAYVSKNVPQQQVPTKELSAKEFRREQLRKLAKNKEVPPKNTTNPTVPHSTEKPKVKVTSKSRNDGLFADIVGKTPEEQQQPHTSNLMLPVSEELRNQMPLQRIIQASSATVTFPDGQTKSAPIQNGPASHASMKQVMQKDSAIPASTIIKDGVQPSAEKSVTFVDKPTINGDVPGPSSSRTKPTRTLSRKTNIDAQQPYRDVLHWNAKWLEEQTAASKKPPPVQGSRLIVSTLPEYSAYTHYVEIMYPLLLMELWASIHSDYTGERSNSRHFFKTNKNKTTLQEFDMGIETVVSQSTCPFLGTNSKNTRSVPQLKNGVLSENPKEWTAITCHAFTDENTELDRVNDLAVVTLHFRRGTTVRKEDGSENLENRKVFAFIQPIGNPVTVDHVTNVHKALYTKVKNAKKKQSFQLTCVLKNDEIDRLSLDTPGSIKKISYISSKMRDFKSVLTLTESELFERIIQPRLDAPKFNPAAKPPNTSAIISTLANRLNASQKTIVQQISERILKNNDPDVMLLHGPPGTGKTSVIVGLILQLVKSATTKVENRPKILVCTPSNTAINEILDRLDKFLNRHYGGDGKTLIIRVGNEDYKTTKGFGLDQLAADRYRESTAVESIDKAIRDCKQELEILNAELKTRTQTKTKSLEAEIKMRELKLQKHKQDRAAFMARASKPVQQSLDNEKQRLLLEAHVICSTLSSCNNSLMKRLFGRDRNKTTSKFSRPKFTCCIVDEATQSTEPESLAPLMLDVNKLVLVGDPLQLPATVLSQEASKNNFGDSLFTRHYNFYKKTFRKSLSPVMHLEYQYRMHPDILKFPNEYFYDNMLKCAKAVLDRENDAKRATKLVPYVFINVAGNESVINSKVSNAEEVTVILEILKTISFHNRILSPQNDDLKLDIGIITPYREQKSDISGAIARGGLTKEFIETIEVDTVDSFQGREKDIIILSCVRTKNMGFLDSRQRLNVALTRAKRSLIIVGDAVFLNKKSDMWKSLMDDATNRTLFKKIPDHCIKQLKSNGLRTEIEKIILLKEDKSEVAEEIRPPRGRNPIIY